MLKRTRAFGLTIAILGLVALAATLAQAAAMVEPDEGLSLETEGAAVAPAGSVPRVRCSSRPGERQHCAANTSAGVALASSGGDAPCLLGKTWGYDDAGVWVSDGCAGEFVVGRQDLRPATAEEPVPKEPKKWSPEYIPNRGFRIYGGDHGQIYMRLFTYVRYLNQKGLDPSYTDYFGNSHDVKQRQDVQLNKFFLPFSGWFLDPRFNYYLYVWSSNPSQGDPAQVVGAGNVSFTFNRYVTLGGGIGCLNSTRSTEGQFPYWLGVDDRMTADEFFRGSYTTGFWVKGQMVAGLNYMAMLANNLSTLGVSASQLDNGLNTTSLSLVWMPTTKEFGFMGEFGDFESHEKTATRLGGHFTHSREDKQSQPSANGIENSQVRLTDGSVIFTPDLFGPGITVEDVSYNMACFDGGIKRKGFALEAEYFRRWLSNYSGLNTGGIPDISDYGFQVQGSAMVIQKVLQAYLSGAGIRGHYGDGSELRAGASWFPFKKREIRLNVEWLHLDNCPVGYTAVPYAVGGNGDVFHTNVVMTF